MGMFDRASSGGMFSKASSSSASSQLTPEEELAQAQAIAASQGLAIEKPKKNFGLSVIAGLARVLGSTRNFTAGIQKYGPTGGFRGISENLDSAKLAEERLGRPLTTKETAKAIATDIALDPVTYLTLGVGGGAKIATEQGLKTLTEQATKQIAAHGAELAVEGVAKATTREGIVLAKNAGIDMAKELAAKRMSTDPAAMRAMTKESMLRFGIGKASIPLIKESTLKAPIIKGSELLAKAPIVGAPYQKTLDVIGGAFVKDYDKLQEISRLEKMGTPEALKAAADQRAVLYARDSMAKATAAQQEQIIKEQIKIAKEMSPEIRLKTLHDLERLPMFTGGKASTQEVLDSHKMLTEIYKNADKQNSKMTELVNGAKSLENAPGIGPVQSAQLKAVGINNVDQLADADSQKLAIALNSDYEKVFGKAGYGVTDEFIAAKVTNLTEERAIAISTNNVKRVNQIDKEVASLKEAAQSGKPAARDYIDPSTQTSDNPVTEAVKAEKTKTYTHQSFKDGLVETDPSFHGTGKPGEERLFKKTYPNEWTDITYAYRPGQKVEHGLGPTKYTLKIPKDKVLVVGKGESADIYKQAAAEAAAEAAAKYSEYNREVIPYIYRKIAKAKGYEAIDFEKGSIFLVKERTNLGEVADTAYKQSVENGGVTITLKANQPAKGYSYSPYKGLETIIPKDKFALSHVDEFVQKNYNELTKTGNHIGIWEEDGNMFLDISRVGAPNEKTLLEAEKNGQLAVYDLEKGETVYTALGKAKNEETNRLNILRGEGQKAIGEGGAPSVSEVPGSGAGAGESAGASTAGTGYAGGVGEGAQTLNGIIDTVPKTADLPGVIPAYNKIQKGKEGQVGYEALLHKKDLLRETLDKNIATAKAMRNALNGSVDNIANPEVKKAVGYLSSSYHDIAQEEMDLGIMHADQELQNYTHRILTPEARAAVEKSNGKMQGFTKELSSSIGSAGRHRSNTQTIEESEQALKDRYKVKGDFYIKDPMVTYTIRKIQSIKAINSKKLFGDIMDRVGVPAEKRNYEVMTKDGIIKKDEFINHVDEATGVEYTVPNVPEFQDAGISVPTVIARDVEKTHAMATNEASAKEFLKLLDKVQGYWKGAQTGFFPAFHARNMIGAAANNFLAGIKDPAVYYRSNQLLRLNGKLEKAATPEAEKIALRAMKEWKLTDVFGHEINGEQLLKAYDFKVGRGTGMTADIPRELAKRMSTDPKVVISGKLNVGRQVLEVTEENVRLPLFIDTWKKTGSFDDAAKNVFKYHFDYSPAGATDFENQYMKRISPFYVFTRHNLPLQLEMLFRQPGKQMAGMRILQKMIDPKLRDQLPQYMQQGTSMQLSPEKNGEISVLTGLGLPLEDLNKISVAGAMSSIGPLKYPAEAISGYSSFYQKPIEDVAPSFAKYYANGPLRALNPGNWLEIRELKQPDGTIKYIGNAQKLYALQSSIGRFTTTLGKANDKNVPAWTRAVGGFTGAQIKNVDLTQERQFRIRQLNDDLNKRLVRIGVKKTYTDYYTPKGVTSTPINQRTQ